MTPARFKPRKTHSTDYTHFCFIGRGHRSYVGGAFHSYHRPTSVITRLCDIWSMHVCMIWGMSVLGCNRITFRV